MPVALRPGELRGAGVGADVDLLGARDRRQHREREVRPDRAGDDVGAVARQHALGELDRDVGLLLVVDLDDLGVELAELAAEMLEREVEAVADVDAEAGARSRERRDHADGQLLGGGRARLDQGADRGRGGEVMDSAQRLTSLEWLCRRGRARPRL